VDVRGDLEVVVAWRGGYRGDGDSWTDGGGVVTRAGGCFGRRELGMREIGVPLHEHRPLRREKPIPARALATTRIARGTCSREKTQIVFRLWFFPLGSARPVNNMRTSYASFSLSASCTFSKNWAGPQKIFPFLLFSFVFSGCEFSG
jgi:hypothetical protein